MHCNKTASRFTEQHIGALHQWAFDFGILAVLRLM